MLDRARLQSICATTVLTVSIGIAKPIPAVGGRVSPCLVGADADHLARAC